MTAYAGVVAALDERNAWPGEPGKGDARCPAHDDGTASLSVGHGDGACAVVTCHAGCNTADVIAALHLPMAALFDDYWTPNGRGRTVEAIYPYVDEAGKLLYEIRRYRPKDFKPYLPGAEKPGIGKTRRVLYRLPKVIEAVAAGRVVFFVEGEKDAEALERAGEVATCHAFGAKGWRTQDAYDEPLRGAAVVVIADADDEGRTKARKVRAKLEGVGATVMVMEARTGKDAHDHLAAGHGVHEFVPWTDDATGDDREGTAPASEREKPQRDTVRAKREVILTPASAIRSERGRWLWRERFPLRGLTVVAGEKGLGKSLLTNAQTVAAITRGTLDGELFGTPADVLIVTAEDDWRAQVKPRLMAHGANLARVHRVEVHDADGVSLLTLPDDVAALEAKIIGLRDGGRIVAMLVVDPIGAFVSEAANTHADAPVRRILAPLAALADRQDVAVVAVMHLTKDEAKRLISRVTGAGAFVNAARSYLAMVPDPDDPEGEQGDRRLLVHVRTNWGRPAPTLALHVEGRDVDTDAGERTNVGYLIVDGESSATVDDVQRGRDDDAEDAEDAIGAALAGASQPSRDVKGQVAKELGCSRKTVQRAAMRMRDRGELTVTEGGFPRTTTWTLARAQEGTERVPTEKKDGVEPNPPVPTGPSPVPTVPTGGNGALEPDSDPDNSSRDTSALSRAHARAADANGGGQAELIPRPDRTDGRDFTTRPYRTESDHDDDDGDWRQR